MNGKRRGLMFLGGTALCLAAIAPTQLSDHRFTRWTSVFGSLGDNLRDTLRRPTSPGQDDADRASRRADAEGEPGPALDQPDAARDGAALKNAYDAAVAAERIRSLGYEPNGILEAIAAYRAGNLEAGDAQAAKVTEPLVKVALEWTALREAPQRIGLGRLQAFQAAHPDWPAATWLHNQMEARLLRAQDPVAVLSFFTTSAPQTALGKLALARALKATGRGADGAKLARSVFRESDLTPYSETALRTEFGGDLTKGDFKYRADKLLYKEKVGPAMRYAAVAGTDVLALEKARAAVIADGPSDKAIAAVPDHLQKDPGLILAEVQKLRRADKPLEAAHLMETAPHDPVQLIDGDEWWTERRILSRKLLDAGKVNAAYIMCAMNSAVSREAKVEAEFHAGWIALRFLSEPKRAGYHFNVAAKLADTPSSIARIAYWQARTLEASADPADLAKARASYEKAANYSSSYYGQLARRVVGSTSDAVQEPPHRAIGDERAEAIRTIELLYAAGDRDSAYALATQAASELTDGRQTAALAAVIVAQKDAHLALTIGKLVGQHANPVDPLAFPTFGIPAYEALANSAPPPVVYAVARQESAFIPRAISKAGAKGLMQMIDATAKRTATKAGLPFDPGRLLNDSQFNARLGAAHLGELIADQEGSLILTFAAYNAGPGRVKQWIDAYGDPRKPGVDPVDWVERIPFTETRNYVQRVTANVGVYEAIFANQARIEARRRSSREAKL